MDADPCYGKFDPENKKTLINASQLRDALTHAGFDPNKSLKGFAERNLIETHKEGNYKGRFQKTATIYGISMRVVVANIICNDCDCASLLHLKILVFRTVVSLTARTVEN